MELYTPTAENIDLCRLLDGGPPEDLQALRQTLLDDWRPRNATERMLVEFIAAQQWKLQHLEGAEMQRLNYLRTIPAAALHWAKAPATIERALCVDMAARESSLRRMQAYEQACHRSIHRAITQLLTLRKQRRRKMGNFQHQRARQKSAEVIVNTTVEKEVEEKDIGERSQLLHAG